MMNKYDDGYHAKAPVPWKCPLCSVKNSRGEQRCRLCQLPAVNTCTGCIKELGRNARFCKYCGEMSVYFRYAVFDPQECILAKKDSAKTVSYWRRRGVRYMNIVDEYDYIRQYEECGQVFDQ